MNMGIDDAHIYNTCVPYICVYYIYMLIFMLVFIVCFLISECFPFLCVFFSESDKKVELYCLEK